MYLHKNYLFLFFLTLSISLQAQFANEREITSTLSPGYQVETSDIDNDGFPDLVVGTHGFLYWQRNKEGTGLFDKAIILDSGNHDFKSVFAADLDGDNDQDVLTVSFVEGWIAYYENLGNGSFGARTILFQDTGNAYAVHATDYDNDGDMDIITASKESGLSIRLKRFRNNGNLNFSNPFNISYIGNSSKTTITSADLNNDGYVDLITTNPTNDNLKIFTNQGNSSFNLTALVPTDSNMLIGGVAVGDFDNDGWNDIFFADYNSAEVYFKNDGTGSFIEVTIEETVGGVTDIKALDYDNDGDIDLAAGIISIFGEQGGGLKILLNDGSGTFTTSFFVTGEGIATRNIAIAHINEDDFADVIAITSSTNFEITQQLVWYENENGNNLLPVKSISEGGKGIEELGVYDFNNDGILDIYLVVRDDQKIVWMERLGYQEYGPTHTVGYVNQRLRESIFYDFDNDGDRDFVVTNDDELFHFDNDGNGNFSEEEIFPGVESLESILKIQNADFDLDGDEDLIVEHLSSGEIQISLIENLGLGNYENANQISTIPVGLRQMENIDLDKDGFVDIVFIDFNKDIYWLRNIGNNNFAALEILLSQVSESPPNLKIVDIDYDEDLDIIIASQPVSGTGDLILYRNQGNSTFDASETIGTFNIPFNPTNGLQLDFGDVDLDGDLDILHSYSGTSWMRQEEDGSFSDNIVLLDGSGNDSWIANLEDIDLDGDLDAFVAYDFSESGITTYTLSQFENFSNNATLQGFLFYDENDNGNFEGDEIKISNQAVNISPAAIASFTNDEGEYNFYVNDGEYTLTPDLSECWNLTTSPTSYSVNTDGTSFQDGFDFGLDLESGDENMEIQLVSAPTRCGFTVPFWLNATNAGCTISNGYIELELDELVTLISTDPVADENNGSALRWYYSDLLPNQKFEVGLSFEIADASNIGSYIEMPVKIFSDENGSPVLGSEFSFSSQINCAYDPNDKQVYPVRTEEDYDENYILPDERLLYTIRFQNTGTDTAFNIVIRDQLSENLEWSTFEPVAASHPFEATLHDDGLVEFHFRDILLVDSFTNEVASHGFVNFKIDAKDDLEENTSINNTAGIYFDFNPPIITNTVENVFVEELPINAPVANFTFIDNAGFYSFTDASTNNPDSWQWDFGDEETSNEQNPNHQYTASGTYDVCLSASNSGGTSEYCFTISVIVSSNSSIREGKRVWLSPNPATDKIILSFEEDLPTNMLWETFDNLGRRISLKSTRMGNDVHFDLSLLPAGIYYVKGSFNGHVYIVENYVVE